MRIAITGATGYVGASLIKYFSERYPQYELIACVRKSSDLRLIASYPVILKEVDLLDHVSLEDAFEGIEVVIHSAALISYFKSDVKAMMQTNVLGTRAVVMAAVHANVKRFIHISSVAAVGTPYVVNEKEEENVPSDESQSFAEWQKSVGYMASKYYAELEVRRAIEEGLMAVILNPGIIVGEYIKTKGGRTPELITRILNNKTIYCPDGGAGFVDIRDVLQAIDKAMMTNEVGKRFIIISENLTYQAIINSILKDKKGHYRVKKIPSFIRGVLKVAEFILGKQLPISSEMLYLASKYLYYDNQKSKSELGLSYIPVEETIKGIIQNHVVHRHEELSGV